MCMCMCVCVYFMYVGACVRVFRQMQTCHLLICNHIDKLSVIIDNEIILLCVIKAVFTDLQILAS